MNLLTYGNDANIAYDYDLGNRLTTLSNNFSDANIIFDYASYDKVGNRLSMKVGDAEVHVYQYDKLYQLTYADYNDGNEVLYGYDKLGNRTSVSINGSPTGYDVNILNQYTAVGGARYDYDRNGNLADINNGQFEYLHLRPVMRYILQILCIYANLAEQLPALLYLPQTPFAFVFFDTFSGQAVLVEYPSYGLVTTGQVVFAFKPFAAFERELFSQTDDFQFKRR